jgi:putative two-component system response regulator
MLVPSVAGQADACILIVDDDPLSIQAITRILTRTGYKRVHPITDPYLAEAAFRELQPDLVLLDLRMPGLDGLELLARLMAATPRSAYLPIIMLTGEDSAEPRQQALATGAKDFIGKPFNIPEVVLRIRNLLETRALHQELEAHNRELEQRVAERTRELDESQLEILQRLATAAELRDDETGQHTYRVAATAAMLARAIGLPEAQVQLVTQAAPLHDVGKIGIPDAVLLKQGQLGPDEFAVIKSHTTIGARMLGNGRSPAIQMAEAIALSHHEWWDGRGYPAGLSGERIPLPARIVSLADVFDALTHDRPYRPAWSVADTLEEIRRLRANQFDPVLADAFLGLENHERLC